MATLDERVLQLEKDSNDMKALQIELGRTVVALGRTNARLEDAIHEVRESVKQNERRISLMEGYLVQSEKRLAFVEDRAAKHDETMAELRLKMEESNRELAQARNFFIRVCQKLGVFDDDPPE